MSIPLRSLPFASLLLLPLAGCSDPAPSQPADAGRDVAADTAADAPGDAAADVANDAAVDVPGDASADASGDGGSGSLRVLAPFNAMMGQLAEGVAVRGGFAYVGFAPTGQVVRVDAMGAVTPFGQVPIPASTNPAMPNGYALGLNFDAAGNLYVAAPSFGMAFQAGVYRMPAAGGMATLFARDAMGRMNFPNAIEFDATGSLFVTDSASGSIFKISADGATVTQWVTHMLLRGGSTMCGPGAGFPIGANGLVVDSAGRNVYVANTDDASIVRVPVNADGTAGTPATLVPRDCMRLGGADGLTRGPDGNLYVASNAANVIARVGIDGMNLTALETRGLLDSPASLVFGTLAGGAQSLFITNAAFTSAQTPGATPRPGLLVRTGP